MRSLSINKLYLLLICLCCTTYAYGQQLETRISINSGVSRFGGQNAAQTTAVTRYGSGAQTYYNNNPYGSRYNLTYGGSLQVQLVTPSHFLLGAQVGFEQLRSSIQIDQVNGHPSSSSSLAQPADGASTLMANYMNLQPYLGWRIGAEKFDIDVTFGSDVGFGQKLQEEGQVTLEDGTKLKAAREYSKMNADIRPRLGLAAHFGPLSASVSYAYGLTDYAGGQSGGNTGAYMRVLRVGMLYRL
jgi:hypothetical protein